MTRLTTLLFSFIFCTSIFAQNSRLEQGITKAQQTFDNADNLEGWQSAANQFERIAQAEKGEWIAAYYAAKVYCELSFRLEDTDKRDAYLDQAQAWIEKAKEIAPEESEIYVLQAFMILGRVAISPMVRGVTMTEDFHLAIDKAKILNPDNPRAYYLDGQYTMNMPQMFGGGMKTACPILEQAHQKYMKFQPPTSIWPSWGGRNTARLMEKCGE